MSVEILREFSIGINFVEIMIELQIFVYFIAGYRRYKSEGGVPDKFTLMAALGFLFGALARVFYIIFDYYIQDELFRYGAWVLLITCLILIFLALFKSATGEIFKDFPHKKLYGIAFGFYVVSIIITRLLATSTLIFYLIIIVVGVVMLIPLVYRFNRWVNKVGGYIKKYFTIAGTALPLAFIGIAIGPFGASLPEFEGWLVKIAGHCIFLISIGLFAIAIWSLPSLSEFDWIRKVHHLYAIMPGGLLAYEYSFTKEKDIDADLLGSGLSGIIDIVKEMTGSVKRLKIIRQEKKNIYLEYGNYITVAIIAEEELKILFEKIARFTKEFEDLFGSVLESWDGNAERFQITDSIVKKIFLS